MRGISEVIAIILILMITIALAAIAYAWFSGMFVGLTSNAGTSITSTSNAMLTDFSIENAKQTTTNGNVTVDIRNVGIATINASQIATYINSAPYLNDASTSCLNGGILSTDAVCQFNVTGITTSMCGSSLMISTGSGFVEYETIDC